MVIAIIVFPGSNRDVDLLNACYKVTGDVPIKIWHDEHDIPKEVDLVILPGGFSYGDYLRSGAIASRANIMYAVANHANNGGMVMGICNGFQILTEAKLLPGSLIVNDTARFINKYQYIKIENNNTIFTNYYKEGDILNLIIAHGEGNYVASNEIITCLENENRVIFRYCNNLGEVSSKTNPNGSLNNIAGICNKNGNVIGLMPHPENSVDIFTGSIDGVGIFKSLMNQFN